MSDSTNPTPLADRITKPESTLNASSSTFTPSSSKSWADEVASPVAESSKEMASVAESQVDGAVEPQGGSGLHDAQYEVEVKLSDIQGDVNSPLFSITSFQELGM
jgi:ATP-dependent RNA helicase DDX19/DBP5